MLRSCSTFLLLLLLLPCVGGCDNVGRAFDRSIDGSDPTPVAGESTVQVVPHGGDSRDGRPKVRAAFPSGGGWPTVVPIVVEFTESINEASILPSSPTGTDARLILRVRGSTQALPCQYDFLAGGRVLLMRPLTELSNAQVPTYEVVLLPDARDVDGIRFTVAAEGLTLAEFQVNQDPSFTDGRILTTYPRDNSREATREAPYLVFFDRPANANTILATNFRLRQAGGAALAGSRDLPVSALGVDDTRIVRFVPDDVLAASTTYELVVDDTITFGTAGKLDFRGRTPFAVFETISPAAPTAVAIGNATSGFPNKVNRTNLSTVVLQVTTAADALPGDRIRARIYGGNATTTAIGDVSFIEGITEVPAAGAQSVTVDFASKLGTLAAPRFDDGGLTIAAQLLRGSQQSGFAQDQSDDSPVFDITPPTLVRAGPPASTDGLDILTDQESLAFFGRASEEIAEASLVDGVNPAVELFASSDDGRFLMRPVPLGRLTAPRPYSLTFTDRAGNMSAGAASGRIVQRGLATGTLAGELTVEVYDETTLLPIANATVFVQPGTPPAAGQQAPTGSNGRATFVQAAATHTITVARGGFHLKTLYGTSAAFVSLPLRPITNATASLAGNVVFAQAPGTTVLVGCTAFDDPAQLDVRTANASPTTIPATAITPNRPAVITAFGGVFEPTAEPTFSLQGIQMLDPTLTMPTPPLSPVGAGAQTTAVLALVPAAGGLADLLGPAIPVDFSLAVGLDTANLVGGAPSVRVLAPMSGFTEQALVGVGFASLVSGANYEIAANFSFPAFVALAPYIASGTGFLCATARDQAGRVSRNRWAFVAASGSVLVTTLPAAIPSITAPSGPSIGGPSVTFEDVFDAAAGLSVYELTAEGPTGRQWVVWATDADATGGQDTVQFPDLAAAGITGLTAGTWNVRVEGRLLASLTVPAPGDWVFTERIRGEVFYVRSAQVAFTVQ